MERPVKRNGVDTLSFHFTNTRLSFEVERVWTAVIVLSSSLLSPQCRPFSLFRFCLPPLPLLSSPLLGSLLLSACRYRDGKKAASFQIKTDFKSLARGSREKHFLRQPSPLPPRLKVSAQGSVDLRGTWNIWQMISGPLSLGYFRVLKSLAAFCLTKLNNVCSSFRFILSLLLLL